MLHEIWSSSTSNLKLISRQQILVKDIWCDRTVASFCYDGQDKKKINKNKSALVNVSESQRDKRVHSSFLRNHQDKQILALWPEFLSFQVLSKLVDSGCECVGCSVHWREHCCVHVQRVRMRLATVAQHVVLTWLESSHRPWVCLGGAVQFSPVARQVCVTTCCTPNLRVGVGRVGESQCSQKVEAAMEMNLVC